MKSVATKHFLEKVNRTIRKYSMFAKGDHVVVGVSGGPDSVALLLALRELEPKLKLSFHVAHLNHGFRGEEAQEDARYTRNLARRLKLPFYLDKKDVPGLIEKSGGSPEEVARNVRYNFFKTVADEVNAQRVAVGQTLDDQAETVLMRILRGTGTGGLGGIPPKRALNSSSVTVVRPLIEVRREEVLSFLKARRIVPREDSSNRDEIYFRNRVRLKLIPSLEKYNPEVKESLSRLADIARVDDLLLEEEAERALEDVILQHEDEKVSLDLDKFSSIATALQRRALRKALELVGGRSEALTLANWSDIENLMLKKGGSAKIDLESGVVVERSYGKLIVLKSKRERTSPYRYQLDAPGEVYVPEKSIWVRAELIRKSPPASELKRDSKRRAYLDFDVVGSPLFLRNRRAGDTFKPLGMSGKRKKVKEVFINLKIPRAERDLVPLLTTSQDEIVWIVGLAIADFAKVRDETKRILLVSI